MQQKIVPESKTPVHGEVAPRSVDNRFTATFYVKRPLDSHQRGDKSPRMKTAAVSFFFALVVIETAVAQEIIVPTKSLDLFNGTNFDGWTFCMRDKPNPGQTWSVTNAVIQCTGTPSGYLRTTQAYSNYVVTVVWRFVKVTPKADNTGVLVHIQSPDKVWPRCIQNQGKSGRQGDLFVMAGAECKEHRGMNPNTPVALRGAPNEHPIGEWNTNVTVCAGNTVKALINGKLLNEINECTVSSGFVGIQSEGAEIVIRRIFLEPLK